MNRDLTPTEGARLLLERTGDGGEYRAAIYTPAATYEGTATLHEDGGADVAIAGAPDELVDALRMLAKLTARGAAARRADGMPVWPARVLRWRGPGRGG
ncbi:MAG TPA: hypothetical protein VMJ10_25205 [Kofleriaceae bacterium]|nr:hypothetical protein [Kofleriaceae bacterium]